MARIRTADSIVAHLVDAVRKSNFGLTQQELADVATALGVPSDYNVGPRLHSCVELSKYPDNPKLYTLTTRLARPPEFALELFQSVLSHEHEPATSNLGVARDVLLSILEKSDITQPPSAILLKTKRALLWLENANFVEQVPSGRTVWIRSRPGASMSALFECAGAGEPGGDALAEMHAIQGGEAPSLPEVENIPAYVGPVTDPLPTPPVMRYAGPEATPAADVPQPVRDEVTLDETRGLPLLAAQCAVPMMSMQVPLPDGRTLSLSVPASPVDLQSVAFAVNDINEGYNLYQQGVQRLLQFAAK